MERSALPVRTYGAGGGVSYDMEEKGGRVQYVLVEAGAVGHGVDRACVISLDLSGTDGRIARLPL